VAFDEALAARLRAALGGVRGVEERMMFGGVAFLVRGNVCVGVHKDALVARVRPDDAGDLLNIPHAKPFDITGRPMAGWILVEPPGLKTKQMLTVWVDRAKDFVRTLPPK
jgi:hypothetical protein